MSNQTDLTLASWLDDAIDAIASVKGRIKDSKKKSILVNIEKELIVMANELDPKGKVSFKKQANKFESEINATLNRKAQSYDETDPEIAPYLDSEYTVNVTFDEQEFDTEEIDSGFEEENEKYDFEELVNKIESEGFTELSSSSLRKPKDAKGVWVTTEGTQDVSGVNRTESLHIEKVDGNRIEPEAVWAIFKAADLV